MNRAGGGRDGPAPGGRVAVLSHALHKLSLVADGAAPLGGDTGAGQGREGKLLQVWHAGFVAMKRHVLYIP